MPDARATYQANGFHPWHTRRPLPNVRPRQAVALFRWRRILWRQIAALKLGGPVIERLLRAWRLARPSGSALDELADAIRAVELHHNTYRGTHAAVIALLRREGIAVNVALTLVSRWLLQGDFLLVRLEGEFDFVVGNPPYVRQERIPAPLLAAYRSRYQTMYDRADLYIPFIELWLRYTRFTIAHHAI